MTKLWQKKNAEAENPLQKHVTDFTVGKDKQFDILLAAADVEGSLAHATMLESIGLISTEELRELKEGLEEIRTAITNGSFQFEEGVEDIHSQIEISLTRSKGEVGKKIHSGRSRNDQSLLDIKLFIRQELLGLGLDMKTVFDQLLALSEKYRQVFLPGYTHLQLAMPSSFGLWFGAYAESLSDDLELVIAAHRVADKNPLGSGAGYGSSFPLNRQLTTQLMGFESMNHNVVYAQMTRGKTEKIAAMAMASVAATLSKFAMDACLFMNQNFGFISFPHELTTGSSIMPHKKNPDVFELIRAKCNRIQAVPNELTLLISNLPSGYHRDLQLTKECLFPAIAELKSCLRMLQLMLEHIRINGDLVKDEKYRLLFTVETVNKLVLSGLSFRDAYKQVGEQIENGSYVPDTTLNHRHEGSMGNLHTAEIRAEFYDKLKKLEKDQ